MVFQLTTPDLELRFFIVESKYNFPYNQSIKRKDNHEQDYIPVSSTALQSAASIQIIHCEQTLRSMADSKGKC